MEEQQLFEQELEQIDLLMEESDQLNEIYSQEFLHLLIQKQQLTMENKENVEYAETVEDIIAQRLEVFPQLTEYLELQKESYKKFETINTFENANKLLFPGINLFL
jgi:hypothetical protein